MEGRGKHSRFPIPPIIVLSIVVMLLAGLVWFFVFAEVGQGLWLSIVGGIIGSGVVLVFALVFLAKLGRRRRVVACISLVLALLGLAVYVLTRYSWGQSLLESALGGMIALGIGYFVTLIASVVVPRWRGPIEDARDEAKRKFKTAVAWWLFTVPFLWIKASRPSRIVLTAATVVVVVALPVLITLVWPVPRVLTDVNDLALGKTLCCQDVNVWSSSGFRDIEWWVEMDAECQTWLSVDPPSGIATSSITPVHVSVDRREMACRRYVTTFQIRYSKRHMRTIEVAVDNTPELSIEQDGNQVDEIVFLPEGDSVVISVSNTGADFLFFDLERVGSRISECIADWDSHLVFPASGISCGPGKERSYEIKLNRERLEFCSVPYAGDVTFCYGCREDTHEITLPIRIHHPFPSISADPNPIELGPANVEDQRVIEVALTNTGESSAIWEFAEDYASEMDWILTMSPTEGNIAVGKSEDVEMHINPCHFPSGSTSADLLVRLRGVPEPYVVTCDLHSVSPMIAIYPSTVNIGREDSKSFEIRNTGCGSLNWHVDWGHGKPNWISRVVPESGICLPNDQDVPNIYVDREGMRAGQYDATIYVAADEEDIDPQPVYVVIVVEPEVAVHPTELVFGYLEDQKTLTIWNQGSGNLEWETSIEIEEGSGVQPFAYMERDHDSSPGRDVADDGTVTFYPRQAIVAVDRSKLHGLTWANATLIIKPTEGEEKAVDITVKNLDFRTVGLGIQMAMVPAMGSWRSRFGICGFWRGPKYGLSGSYSYLDTGDISLTSVSGTLEVHGDYGIGTWSLGGGFGGVKLDEQCPTRTHSVLRLMVVGLAEYELHLCKTSEVRLSLCVSTQFEYVVISNRYLFDVGVGLRLIGLPGERSDS